MRFWPHPKPAKGVIVSMAVSATAAIALVISAAYYAGALSFTAYPQYEYMVALAMILCATPNIVMLHAATPCRRLAKLKKHGEPASYSIIIDGTADTRRAIVDLLHNLVDTTSPKQVIFLHRTKTGCSIGMLQAASLLWDSSRMPKVLAASSFDSAMRQVTAETTVVIKAAHVRFCRETISRAMTAFTADEVLCVEDAGHRSSSGNFWARFESLYASFRRVEDTVLPDIAGVALPTEAVTFFRTEMLKIISKNARSLADVDHRLRQRLLSGGQAGLMRHNLGITGIRRTYHCSEALETAHGHRAFSLSRQPWTLLRKYDVDDAAAAWLACQLVRQIVTGAIAPLYCVAAFLLGGSLATHVLTVGVGLYYLHRLVAINFRTEAEQVPLRKTLVTLVFLPLFELAALLTAPREEERPRLAGSVQASRGVRRPTA